MEEWVPLFEIFLNSPSPERDASLWFQQNPPHSSTSSFLSFLLSPTRHRHQKNQQQQQQPIIFIQTLSAFVQYRILSFLTYDSTRFTSVHLRSLAAHIVDSDPSDFWVRRAACHLLDAVSPPFEPRIDDEEFYSLPPFLNANGNSPPLLPWLPLSPTRIPRCTSASLANKPENQDVVMLEEEEQVESCSPLPSPLDPLSRDKALALKAALSGSDSTSSALRIAHEIRNLCFLSGPRSQLALMELIEPWEADDETSSVLLSNLCDDDSVQGAPSWPARVLCSVLLPKLLTLKTPASRVLLLATISFCKLHPVAAIDALVFPLTLCNEGVNVHLCDVLARIVKECLHPSHVSAFCQRLLCGQDRGRRNIVCLPCHRGLISESVVWTEPIFTLFQHILNRDVYLTPDATRQLVLVIDEVADRFSRSLKFGNFLLCFITKCAHASEEFDKILMERVVKKTDTFMTKSILSKLEVD